MTRLTSAFALSAALALGACQRDAATASPDTASADGGADASGDAQAREGKAADPLAEALAEAEAEAAEEAKRWTPELKAQVQALVSARYATASDALKAALASEHRKPGNAARDVYRRPVEVMEFFGLTPDMTVVEVGAGGGWWTELLAVVLYERGKLIVPSSDSASSDPRTAYFGRRDELLLGRSEILFGRVERHVQPEGKAEYGPDGSADMVLVFRMLHNWHRYDLWHDQAQAALRVLKPGGVLAVIQHRAPEGADPDEWAKKGYLPEDFIVKAMAAEGFELAARSDLLANPKDTKDYPKGVWTLPPTFALGDQDRDRYAAIGESDRVALKFVKPKG